MNHRDTLLDDLELSTNTASWVRSLGVKTLGELLDLASLCPPDDLIEEELAAHLEELGLCYEGEVLARSDADHAR